MKVYIPLDPLKVKMSKDPLQYQTYVFLEAVYKLKSHSETINHSFFS
jgi:hypothetical protein